MSPLTKALFSVSIEDLIVCRNAYEKLVFHATPSPRARENVTGCTFTINGVLKVINSVAFNPPFLCYLFFSVYSICVELVRVVTRGVHKSNTRLSLVELWTTLMCVVLYELMTHDMCAA